MLKFKLRTMLAAIAFLGLFFGSLVGGSAWCGLLLDAVVWLLLVGSIILSFSATDQIRMFCRGFVIAGGLYFAMAFVGALRDLPGPHRIVEQGASGIHKVLVPLHAGRVAQPGFTATTKNPDRTVWQVGPNAIWRAWESREWAQTQRAMDELVTIIIGCLGGILAVRFGAILNRSIAAKSSM